MKWNRILSKQKKKKEKELRGQVKDRVEFLRNTLGCVPLLKSETREPLIGKKKKRESYLSCSIVHSEAILRPCATSLGLPASPVPTGTLLVIEVVTLSRI